MTRQRTYRVRWRYLGFSEATRDYGPNRRRAQIVARIIDNPKHTTLQYVFVEERRGGCWIVLNPQEETPS